MPQIKQILVPIDWSKPSNRAFELAKSLAEKHDAQLLLLYVVPVPSLMYGPPSESYLEHVQNELCRIRPNDPKIRVKHLIAEGNPAAAILRAAKDNDCDLIVMGTHGRTGLSRFLMGSVAEEVICKAPCSVLTAKAKGPVDDCGDAQASEGGDDSPA
jgi:universal stress protein A